MPVAVRPQVGVLTFSACLSNSLYFFHNSLAEGTIPISYVCVHSYQKLVKLSVSIPCFWLKAVKIQVSTYFPLVFFAVLLSPVLDGFK